MRPFYRYIGNSYIGKIASLYQVIFVLNTYISISAEYTIKSLTWGTPNPKN